MEQNTLAGMQRGAQMVAELSVAIPTIGACLNAGVDAAQFLRQQYLYRGIPADLVDAMTPALTFLVAQVVAGSQPAPQPVQHAEGATP